MKSGITIAFFTGQSDPRNNALSSEQASFLEKLAAPGRELIRVNFPWTTPTPRAYRNTLLPLAAWNNTRLYLASRSKRFSAQHAPVACSLIERGAHTVFLAGSCGLELFNNLRLPPEIEARCTLICYGPVARQRPTRAAVVIAQGRRDWISRALFQCETTLKPQCGHMDYLRNPEFLRHCQQQLAHLTTTCSNTSA